MKEIVLETRGLAKRYGRRWVVEDLDLSVRQRDVYGFLGRNGAGKSTTIRMILGLVRPTRGEVLVAGRTIRAGGRRSPWPVGAIIESPVFYDYLSGRTNLELLASLSGGAPASRIGQVLELVGLTDRQRDPVGVYSHGMRQRLGLAQALLPRPELLILDEPLDGLDPNGIRDLRQVMTNVVETEGVTIFLSSHILSEVELTCNRVLVIHQGRRVFEGSTAELIADAGHVRLRTAGPRDPEPVLRGLGFIEAIGRENGAWRLRLPQERVPELNRALVAAEIDVMELTPLRRRLEDIFIGLTEAAGSEGAG